MSRTTTYTPPSFAPASAPNTASGLAPYRGDWTAQEAGHLLSRATFGATFATLRQSTALGLDGTLDLLLADAPLPPPPLIQKDDPLTPVGQPWLDSVYPSDPRQKLATANARRNNLRAWWQQLRLEEGISARETMVLFWHNHFGINGLNDPLWNYNNNQLMRREAFGSFDRLIKDMTVDPLMLTFLNGNRSTNRAPNENYARELLELFTVGKGPQAGPGDHTNYTEQDVLALARSLTGWRTRGYRREEPAQQTSAYFQQTRHDDGTVELSERLGGVMLASSGPTTYIDAIDIILQQQATAEYIVRKFYRWFVYYRIDADVETNVIQPLAAIFRDNNYEIKPVLRALFASEHFFDVRSQGPMIKHPIRYVVGLLREFQVQPASRNRLPEDFHRAIFSRTNQIGMADYRIPTVAGWKAFYQEPLYYRDWINSATLPIRQILGTRLFATRSILSGYGTVSFSLLDEVDKFATPADVWVMIGEWVSLLFPRPIPQAQLEFLKDVLLPGLPDSQWAVEYANYLADPSDNNIKQALENNLRRMVKTMIEMPEYQLC